MINEAIVKLVNREDLTSELAEQAVDEIMGGQASEIQISAFLTALAEKGATVEEIAASARGMRNHAVRLETGKPTLEIVGTGGDKSNSFNISTVSSLVISAAGVPVTKHGNRAATSKCGAADVLEALGVKIDAEPEVMQRCLRELNICFLFAQKYHQSMRFVAPVRKQLPMPTVFNILGPLTNPAFAEMQLMGVYEEGLVEKMAHVLYSLGVTKGMVVFGQDGLDEISVCGPTSVCEVRDGAFSSYCITPEEFGLKRCRKEDLVGGMPEENAAIARAILNGEQGPKRDAVVLNTAAALHIAKGIGMQAAVAEAQELLDSGKAAKQLDAFIAMSNA